MTRWIATCVRLARNLIAFGALMAAPTPPPANAQTQTAIVATGAMSLCLLEYAGSRTAARAAELDLSIQQAAAQGWHVNQIAPGVFRMTRRNYALTVEIKLPDASGAAHCLVFGPTLTPNDAAIAADRFLTLGRLGQMRPLQPGPGMIRRYGAEGLPFGMELMAYSAQGFGNVVGLVFSGVDPNQRTTRLAGPGTANAADVRAVMGGAVVACMRYLTNPSYLRAGLEAAGLTYHRPTDSRGDQHTYFGANNAVQVNAGGYLCDISSQSMQAAAAVQLVATTVNAQAPGAFWPSRPFSGQCGAFHASRSLTGGPLGIIIRNYGSRPSHACNQAAPARISFEIPG